MKNSNALNQCLKQNNRGRPRSVSSDSSSTCLTLNIPNEEFKKFVFFKESLKLTNTQFLVLLIDNFIETRKKDKSSLPIEFIKE